MEQSRMGALARSGLALLLWITAASAQTAGPSDNDLFAAYCVGVSKSMVEGLKQTRDEPCARGAAGAECRESKKVIGPSFDDWIRDSENKRLRFVRYLAARGYLTNHHML